MSSQSVEPEFAYLKLRCDPQTQELITWRLIIDRAMSRFGGRFGVAIPIDIMYVSAHNSQENYNEAIIRCPAEQQQIVSSGVSGSTDDEYSVRLVDWSNYLSMLI